ncbi:MAG: murein DD-endopeptidase MepM/ murein hydrolase activator NlpD [Halieaceae bacterium]
MKVIVISTKHGRSRTFTLGNLSKAMLSVCFLGIPFGMAVLGYQLIHSDSSAANELALHGLQESTELQGDDLENLRQKAEHKLQALTLRVAEMQARLVRLDAVGERLTSMAGLDAGEFDFSSKPAQGGPIEQDMGLAFSDSELMTELSTMDLLILDREQQLQILEDLLTNRRLEDEIYLAGRPIKQGWQSSAFGRRTDPFSGRAAWHSGIDFAGKENSEIIAVASGVVTWVGNKSGYGAMVEVGHGGGFTTRYAHNKENLVKIGDIVKQGQAIALMGNSGRSTGPHVHYEVYKHGRAVDPASYVHRTRR